MKNFNDRSADRISRSRRDILETKYSFGGDKTVSFDLQDHLENDNNIDYDSVYQPNTLSKRYQSNPRNLKSEVNQTLRKGRSLRDEDENFNNSAVKLERMITPNSGFQEGHRKLHLNGKNYIGSKIPNINRLVDELSLFQLAEIDPDRAFEESINILALESPAERRTPARDSLFFDKSTEIVENKRNNLKDTSFRKEDTSNLNDQSFVSVNNEQQDKKEKLRRLSSFGKNSATKESEVKFKKVYNWRKQHAILLLNMRGKLLDPEIDKEDKIRCEYCLRYFNPLVAERHIPKCREIVHRPNPPSTHILRGITPNDASTTKSFSKKNEFAFLNGDIKGSTTMKGKFISYEKQDFERARNLKNSVQKQASRPSINSKQRFTTDQMMDSDPSMIDYSNQQYISERPREDNRKSENRNRNTFDDRPENYYSKSKIINNVTVDYEEKINQSFTIGYQYQNSANNRGNGPIRQLNDSIYRLPPLPQPKGSNYRASSISTHEQRDKEGAEHLSFSKERMNSLINENSVVQFESYSKTPCPFCNKFLPSQSLNSHVPLCKALKAQSSKLIGNQSYLLENNERTDKHLLIYKARSKHPNNTLEEKTSSEKPLSNKDRNRSNSELFSEGQGQEFNPKLLLGSKETLNNNNLVNPFLNRLRLASNKALESRKICACKYCGSSIPKSHAFCGICGKKKLF